MISPGVALLARYHKFIDNNIHYGVLITERKAIGADMCSVLSDGGAVCLFVRRKENQGSSRSALNSHLQSIPGMFEKNSNIKCYGTASN